MRDDLGPYIDVVLPVRVRVIDIHLKWDWRQLRFRRTVTLEGLGPLGKGPVWDVLDPGDILQIDAGWTFGNKK